MNTNFFQTILTVLALVSGLLSSLLISLGCHLLPNGNMDCTTNTAPVWLAPYLIMAVPALTMIKLILGAFEGKLTKPTVTVTK